MRPRRYRHNFHTFAFSDKEEEVLSKAKQISSQGLTDTLIKAIETYVTNNQVEEKEDAKTSLCLTTMWVQVPLPVPELFKSILLNTDRR